MSHPLGDGIPPKPGLVSSESVFNHRLLNTRLEIFYLISIGSSYEIFE
jgi:hypothetical protein